MDIPEQSLPAVIEGQAMSAPAATAFSFGDPEPVLDRRSLLGLDHMECWRAGKWYEPPISLAGLARSRHASPHHASAIRVKLNLLTESFIPHPKLSRTTFRSFALDYLTLANGYLEKKGSVTGRTVRLERALAKYMRRGVELDRYYFLTHGAYGGLRGEHEFEAGAVVHLLEPDIDQEIYGVPEYLSALQSAFLNEAATIFRRRYYLNGSHAGFILYMTDGVQDQTYVDDIRQALKDSKGPGNFRNLFVYAPNGKKDGIQLIPVSEVAAKDQFPEIKNTSRDDILAVHRVPPQLIGMVPANAGGFGDVAKARDVFIVNEIIPLQSAMRQVNDVVGEEVVRFREPEFLSVKLPASEGGGRAAAP